jgi:ribonuclease P protein component
VNPKFRLTQSRDFARVKGNHQSAYHPLAVLVYVRNELDYSRAAVVASKKVGVAVIRNRVRRRMKACLQENWKSIHPGWDLIFYLRSAIVSADYQDIQNAIMHLLKEAGAL